MPWIKLVYYPRISQDNEIIKTHIVHDSVELEFLKDIKSRYGLDPESRSEIENLSIDPGGMIYLLNNAIKTEIDSLNVSVKPEHIILAIKRWTRKREIEKDVFRVYISDFMCIGVRENQYYKIGAWLASKQAEGYVAQMELIETLKISGGDESIIVMPRVADAEA